MDIRGIAAQDRLKHRTLIGYVCGWGGHETRSDTKRLELTERQARLKLKQRPGNTYRTRLKSTTPPAGPPPAAAAKVPPASAHTLLPSVCDQSF